MPFITSIGGIVARHGYCAGVALNEPHIILGWIFSMLFSDFMAQGLRSIPTPPMVAFTEFLHTNAKTNVYHDILFLICNGRINVLVCIYQLGCRYC